MASRLPESEYGDYAPHQVEPDPKRGKYWRAERTHCIRGHSLADTYVNPRGARECRVCQREHRRAWKKRNPDKLKKWQGGNQKVDREVTCPDCGKKRTIKIAKGELTQRICIKCAGLRRRGRRADTPVAHCPCGKEFRANKHRKFCSRECLIEFGGYKELGRQQSIARQGSGNPAYKHGKRVGANIPGWNRAAKGEYSCRNCGSNERVELHHAIPRGKCRAVAADLRNGLPLCMKCHRGWHAHRVVLYRDIFREEEWDFLQRVRLTGQNTEAWLDGAYPERPAHSYRDDFRLILAAHPASVAAELGWKEADNKRWDAKRALEAQARETGRDPYFDYIREEFLS
jgi:hypothetical protein